jgi:hypothetical protein
LRKWRPCPHSGQKKDTPPCATGRNCGRAHRRRRRRREAASYRETAPHECTVRWRAPDEGDNADFDRFVTLIRRFGRVGFYHRVRHLYWTIDEFNYWTMGRSVPETVVINRAQ